MTSNIRLLQVLIRLGKRTSHLEREGRRDIALLYWKGRLRWLSLTLRVHLLSLHVRTLRRPTQIVFFLLAGYRVGRGDPRERAVQRRARRQRSVHPQALPRGFTPAGLVQVTAAQVGAHRRGGGVERLPLHQDEIQVPLRGKVRAKEGRADGRTSLTFCCCLPTFPSFSRLFNSLSSPPWG